MLDQPPHITPATFSQSSPRPHFTRTTRTPAASNAPSTNPSRSFTFARWCDESSNSNAATTPKSLARTTTWPSTPPKADPKNPPTQLAPNASEEMVYPPQHNTRPNSENTF